MKVYTVTITRTDEEDEEGRPGLVKELQAACSHGYLVGMFDVTLDQMPHIPELPPLLMNNVTGLLNLVRDTSRRSVALLKILGVPSNSTLVQEWVRLSNPEVKSHLLTETFYARLQQLDDLEASIQQTLNHAYDVHTEAERLDATSSDLIEKLRTLIQK